MGGTLSVLFNAYCTRCACGDVLVVLVVMLFVLVLMLVVLVVMVALLVVAFRGVSEVQPRPQDAAK